MLAGWGGWSIATYSLLDTDVEVSVEEKSGMEGDCGLLGAEAETGWGVDGVGREGVPLTARD